MMLLDQSFHQSLVDHVIKLLWLVWVKKKYTSAASSKLFGEIPDSVDEVVIYEINPYLQQGDYEQIPAETFARIYQR